MSVPPMPDHPEFETWLRSERPHREVSFSPSTEEYLCHAFEVARPYGITCVRLILGAFLFGSKPEAPSVLRRLVAVAGAEAIQGIFAKADIPTLMSAELYEIESGGRTISKDAASVLQSAIQYVGNRSGGLFISDIFQALRESQPSECDALQFNSDPFWKLFGRWVDRAVDTERVALKTIRDLRSEFPLSSAMTRFVEWMVQREKESGTIGLIGPQSLLSFLIGWAKGASDPLTIFVRNEIRGAEGDWVSQAIAHHQPYEAAPRDLDYPYVTSQVESIFDHAEMLIKQLHRDEIDPHHLFAAMLLRAAKDEMPDVFLDFDRNRVRELRRAFLRYVRDAKLGEAWEYWDRVLAEEPGGGAGSVIDGGDNQPVTNEEEPSFRGPRSATAAQGGGTAQPEGRIVGDAMKPRRYAGDGELCLDVDEYAEAIEQTFRSAADEDDFVFALYGPWGRGKSTLMGRVSEKLQEASTEKGKLRYTSIAFSAWKFPSRPEVWVYLYEQILKEAQAEGAWQKFRIAFRIGLLKEGWGRLYWGATFLALSRLQLDTINWLLNTLGLIGCLILISFAWKAMQLGKAVGGSYFAIPSHVDKLGLQAVIGEDLKSLLKVWVKPEHGTPRPQKKDRRGYERQQQQIKGCEFAWFSRGFNLLVGVVAIALITLGLVDWKERRHLDTSPSVSSQSDSGTLGPIRLVDLFCGGIAAVVVGGAWVIAQRPRQTGRVLLVVDDLDRCEPDQMLAVIESLRLFLDDEEMSRRFQVAMLVDRKILRRTIVKKAKKAGLLETDESAEKYFRQQEEKYFVVSLELPVLNSKQTEELASRLVNHEYLAQLDEDIKMAEAAAATRNPPGEMVNVPGGVVHSERSYGATGPVVDMSGGQTTRRKVIPPSLEDIQKIEEVRQRGKKQSEELKRKRDAATRGWASQRPLAPISEAPTGGRGVTFTQKERDLLIEAVKIIPDVELTPRTYRAFVLRYQLVRLLLLKLRQPFSPEEVVNELAARLFGGQKNNSPRLDAVAIAAITSVASFDEAEPA